MKTTLAQDIDIAKSKARLDEAANNLIANKHVIAHIMRECLTEYKDTSVEDIMTKYLEGTPSVNRIPLEPEDPGKIQGLATDDKHLLEGNVYFDIHFSALVPNSKEKLRLIIVVENQWDFYPGYPLLKRAGYYCGRLISSQKGKVFVKEHYEKLQKVYVIFLCFNPPKSLQNTITRYAIKEENVIGKVQSKREDYDLLSIVMVCLGSPERAEKDLLRLLNVLLSQELPPDTKKNILKDDFAIPMTYETLKEASKMLTMWDVAERQGMAKGISQGRIEAATNVARRYNLSVEDAMDAIGINHDDRETYAPAIAANLAR